METCPPRYEWGQSVLAATDLFNDGSYPEQSSETLLVKNGESGAVVQVGRHTDSRTVVYMVEFPRDRVVGCFEHELAPAQSNGGAK